MRLRTATVLAAGLAKVEDPRWLYWADKMGLLVRGEMANAYEFTEKSADRKPKADLETLKPTFAGP